VRLLTDKMLAMSQSQSRVAFLRAAWGLAPHWFPKSDLAAGRRDRSGSSRGGGPDLSLPPPEPGETRRSGLWREVLCPRIGILFSRIQRLFNPQKHNVIIIELDNAGKTIIHYDFL
jgi:hypothetical protein